MKVMKNKMICFQVVMAEHWTTVLNQLVTTLKNVEIVTPQTGDLTDSCPIKRLSWPMKTRSKAAWVEALQKVHTVKERNIWLLTLPGVLFLLGYCRTRYCEADFYF